MKILEVRDGFIKFEANEDVFLSSLVRIDGQEKIYIAQVLQIKNGIGVAKILYLFNGQLIEYDKTEPNTDSTVTTFSIETINKINENDFPVIVGKYSDENIIADAKNFDKKSLFCVDNKSNKNLLIQNFAKQFNNLNKKVIIIDSTGTIEAKKYVAGMNFKLPLDKNSIKFIYEECLNDATLESKSLIVEIFKDLLEYASSVDYVPFKVLKSIIDDMVDKSHIFKLLVLKNKLARFDRLGYFANDKKDVDRIKKILASKCSIVDISKLDSTFLNRYLTYIYQYMEQDNQVIVELSSKISKKSLKNIFDSTVSSLFISQSDFKFLKDIKGLCENYIIFPSINNNRIFSEFGAFLNSMNGHEYLVAGKYTGYIPLISTLQPIVENAAAKVNNIEPDKITTEKEPNEDYEEYENQNESYGDTIIENITEKSQTAISSIAEELEEPQNIEMFSEEDEQNDNQEDESELNEIVERPEIIQEDGLSEIENDSSEDISEELLEEHSEEAEEYEYTTVTHESNILEEDDAEDVNNIELSEQSNITEDNDVEEEIVIETDDIDDFEDSSEQEDSEQIEIEELDNSEINTEEDELSENNAIPEEDVIMLDGEEDSSDYGFTELDSSEVSENDILVDIEDEPVNLEDELNEQIKKDVDQVYTTIRDDEVSESDLDFIDEIKNDRVLEQLPEGDALEELEEYSNEQLEEYESQIEPIKEEPEILETRNSSTPIVPVYDADIPPEDIVNSDPIEQGDSVSHVKYGHGIVEKLVKYGSKTLYMINFDMGGRKLLDPLLTEIKKN